MTTALAGLAPAVVVFATALVVMAADLFLPDDDVRPPAALSLIGLGAALVLALRQWPQAVGGAGLADLAAAGVADGLVRVDAFGLFVGVALILVAILVAVLSIGYADRYDLARAEFFVLLLAATAGMMVFVVANDLILLFLCLETFSIALYVMCAMRRGERRGQEAALKYFVLGAVAAGFTLYGIALLYAATGSTRLDVIGAMVAASAESPPVMLYAGMALVLVGLGFKIAVTPFHQWTPDVYEGAPVPVTAFMAAATKAAAFAVLLRVLWTAFPAVHDTWAVALGASAVLTIVIGNLAALVQSDLKRMLAYSAVAHAGYLLVAVVVGTPEAIAAALFYLLVYAVMNVGAFGVLVAIGPTAVAADVEAAAAHGASSGASGSAGLAQDAPKLEDLRGLARRHGGLAVAMSLFLFSLAGLPPTAGFLAKWYLFQATIDGGFVVLALAVALGSVLSAFYYLRPVAYMFMAAPVDDGEISVATGEAIVIATTAAVVALALVLAGPLVEAARTAGSVGAVRAAEIEASPEDAPPPMYFSPPEFEKGRKTRPEPRP